MKKKELLFIFILSLLFISCKDQTDKNELQPVPSSKVDLIYPNDAGTSGDTINGLLGYGYDASGFCDTISVKAKVLENIPQGDIFFGHPNTAFPTIVNGGSFEELSNKIMNPDLTTISGEALIHHIKSLISLTGLPDSVNAGFAYTYYSTTSINAHWTFYYTGLDTTQYLTPEFKNDISNLTPKEIVSKYGTHVLTDVYTGLKFEVIYRCKLAYPDNGENGDICENLFYDRIKEFAGGTVMILSDYNEGTDLSQTDEQLFYNSVGSKAKICGVIYPTDYNPDSIGVDLSHVFDTNNIKFQFISIGKDGLLPIYDLISDTNKKQEVKTYIDNYLSLGT